MALQSQFYTVEAGVRTYISTKHIASKLHMAVWIKTISTGTWSTLSTQLYDLINNTAVLDTALDPAIYSELELRVADAPSELSESPSNIATVAAIAADIATVANIDGQVVNLSTVSVEIAALYLIKAKMESLYADKITLDSLYADKAKLDSLYTDKAKLDSLYADKATLDSLYADKLTLDSLFTDKATLDSLFADKATLDSLFTDKIKLDSIYADKATLDSIYADKITLDSIYTDKIKLDAIYANLTAINAIYTNLAAILDASNQAAAAAASASASATSATDSQLRAWEAEAEYLTAKSYAVEAEDVPVNVVTSDGDGTFTYTPQTGVYSALHHATKGLAQDASTKLPKDGSEPMTGNLEAPSMSIGGNFLSAFSFKNQLINGGLDIWQRGTSGFSGNVYTADRWLKGANATVSRSWVANDSVANIDSPYGIRVQTTSSTFGVITQFIENGARFIGRQWTLSFKAKITSIATGSYVALVIKKSDGTTLTSDYIYNWGTADGVWTDYSFTFNMAALGIGGNDPAGYFAILTIGGVGSTTGTCDITYTDIQLEEGAVATPFENRPIALEEYMCKRYFERLSLVRYFTGQCISTTIANFIHVFGIEKRVSPTVTFSGSWNVSNATGGGVAVTSIIWQNGDEQYMILRADVASGLVAGYATYLSSGAYIDIDAEITV